MRHRLQILTLCSVLGSCAVEATRAGSRELDTELTRNFAGLSSEALAATREERAGARCSLPERDLDACLLEIVRRGGALAEHQQPFVARRLRVRSALRVVD